MLDDAKEALPKGDITGLTITEVRGFGRQKGHVDLYRGSEYELSFAAQGEARGSGGRQERRKGHSDNHGVRDNRQNRRREDIRPPVRGGNPYKDGRTRRAPRYKKKY